MGEKLLKVYAGVLVIQRLRLNGITSRNWGPRSGLVLPSHMRTFACFEPLSPADALRELKAERCSSKFVSIRMPRDPIWNQDARADCFLRSAEVLTGRLLRGKIDIPFVMRFSLCSPRLSLCRYCCHL